MKTTTQKNFRKSINRLRKIHYNLDGTNETTYYISQYFMQIRNSSGVYNYTYIWVNGKLLARKNPDGSKWFYHPDHLGSTTLITNETGGVVEETTYLPFGDVNSGGEEETHLYTGKERDDTGLYYYEARYYYAYMRQFVEPDTVIQDPYNPQNLNRYSYVLNNPYKYVDPSGNFFAFFADISRYPRERIEYAINSFSEGINQAWSEVPANELLEGVYQMSPIPDVLDISEWAVAEMWWQVEKDSSAKLFGPKNMEEIGGLREDAGWAGVSLGAGQILSGSGIEPYMSDIVLKSDQLYAFLFHKNIYRDTYESFESFTEGTYLEEPISSDKKDEEETNQDG